MRRPEFAVKLKLGHELKSFKITDLKCDSTVPSTHASIQVY